MAEADAMYPEGPPPYHPSAIQQWASRLIRVSSQYNSTTWSGNMVLGEPRVYPQHGDIHGAWASADVDANQFIELGYEVPVSPTAINIYETYNPGAVVAVKIMDEHRRWETLWSTTSPVHLKQSRIFSPPLRQTRSKTSSIRLELDCTKARTWCEIDAVLLVGIRDGAVAPVDDKEFIASLETMVNNKEFSDVKFELDGKKLYAHKAFLAARSQYFAEMFKGKTQDMVVLKLPHTSHKDMRAIFHFIYTNRLPHDCERESLIHIADVAAILKIPELKTAAMYKILESMTCNNVVDTIMLLKDSDKDDVKEICMKFIADHITEVAKTPGFNKLPQEVLVRVIQEATANMSVKSPRPSNPR